MIKPNSLSSQSCSSLSEEDKQKLNCSPFQSSEVKTLIAMASRQLSFCFNGISCADRLEMVHGLPKMSNLVMCSKLGRRNELGLFSGRLRVILPASRSELLDQPSRTSSLQPCQAKSEDSEGTLTDETTTTDEKTLKDDLQAAIEEENYAKAAEIRDSLRNLQEDIKTSVLSANARFYNAFRKGDLAAMQALWARGSNACCVHPGAGAISGYDLVMESWDHVLAHAEFPLKIELKDVRVHVRGDIGYITCLELVKTKGSSWGKQFATNVFERIDGQWFICIHHASYIAM